MIEPMNAAPKPFTTASYLISTTLWVFLLPGAIVHIVLMLAMKFVAIHVEDNIAPFDVLYLYFWLIVFVLSNL